MTQRGINYFPPPKSAWQELADDPGEKIAAIKACRAEHGADLAGAKQAVEEAIEGNSG